MAAFFDSTQSDPMEDAPEGEPPRKSKDWWEKTKVISGAALTLLGLIIPFIYHLEENSKRDQETRIQRRAEAYKLISEREKYEMDFRASHFEMLLSKVTNPNVKVGERIAILHLFYHNFPDRFNPRVFFDVLDQEAREKKDTLSIDQLKSLAIEISKNEESLVQASTGQERKTIWINEGGRKTDTLLPIDPAHPDTHLVSIKLLRIHDEAVEVHVDFGKDLVDVPDSFGVNYFNTPFTDYTILPDGHRFAITLKEIDRKAQRARLRVTEFPAHYLITGDRPTAEEVNEMVGEIMAGEVHHHERDGEHDSHKHIDE
ncbi:MAG: hypothetical protein HYR76_07805 [Ignavibacteria bacterium]|nr:hypothetical protein [Ignavibacteria bacterium]MBI3766153.1 hypothetical protein [Ignavibacteriales bacterium]